MKPEVNSVFFFRTFQKSETGTEPRHQPHYGRFLRLIPECLIEMTWITGIDGTDGTETVVTVEFSPEGTATEVRVTHAGFLDQAACDLHAGAWPLVLEQLERRMSR